VVEEARLESVYTPKAYRGFESPSLRNNIRRTKGCPYGSAVFLLGLPLAFVMAYQRQKGI